jgi:hypothetical protein
VRGAAVAQHHRQREQVWCQQEHRDDDDDHPNRPVEPLADHLPDDDHRDEREQEAVEQPPGNAAGEVPVDLAADALGPPARQESAGKQHQQHQRDEADEHQEDPALPVRLRR